ncbi:MAG: type I-U CRISPR-associated RAMP protein Csb1/Cas7u [Candidatus Eremiobacteraeota bacterium]|nr:type I-U CRISPR-associated RAMP protein Csb1/Cas7u [Candidatus Eremiobacteraeota bacterium]
MNNNVTVFCDQILKSPRLLLECELEPVQGERFQPTGFPDIGSAVYELPDGRRKILVESAQSMANRFEKVCVKGDGPGIDDDLAGIPYIKVKLKGALKSETSSLVEAHRINSPFIIKAHKSKEPFESVFRAKSGYEEKKPIDWQKVAGALLYYDPSSLVHGVFMANIGDGRLKVPRLLSAFIEAEDVREVSYGGVKNNAYDPKGEIRAKDFDKDVYGNVPYHRTEYTASVIKAYFNIDITQLQGYFAGNDRVKKFFLVFCLLKIRRFLNRGLRLRTSCDFKCKGGLKITMPEKLPAVPDEGELLNALQSMIKECADEGLFASPAVTELECESVKKESKAKPADDGAVNEERESA